MQWKTHQYALAGSAAPPVAELGVAGEPADRFRSARVGGSLASVAGSICTQSRSTAPRKSSAQVAICMAMRSARGDVGAAASSRSCTSSPARCVSSFIAA